MSKNKQQKKRTVIKPGEGPDLVLLAGLPRDTMRWIQNLLTRDPTIVRARFEGTPSTKHDNQDLYPPSVIEGLRGSLAASVTYDGKELELTPRRILVLYVPSGAERLADELGLCCYLQPLVPESDVANPYDGIRWRHQKSLVKLIVYNALQKAVSGTNKLTEVITKKSMSPLTLPARNFYFPTSQSAIEHVYKKVMRGEIGFEQLDAQIVPKKFTDDQLPPPAFKSGRRSDRFFQDERDRIFPPDRHAYNRYAHDAGSGSGSEEKTAVEPQAVRVLEQRYRFGVVVRDGNQHYDVQYAKPRQLQNEPMYCAAAGQVSVTGTHANVGVNDVIWTPGGQKEIRGR